MVAVVIGSAGCGSGDDATTPAGTAGDEAPALGGTAGGSSAQELADCIAGAGLTAEYTDLGIGETSNERVVVELDGVGNGAEVIVFASEADAKEDRGLADALYSEVADYGTVLVGFTEPASSDSDGVEEIDACITG